MNFKQLMLQIKLIFLTSFCWLFSYFCFITFNTLEEIKASTLDINKRLELLESTTKTLESTTKTLPSNLNHSLNFSALKSFLFDYGFYIIVSSVVVYYGYSYVYLPFSYFKGSYASFLSFFSEKPGAVIETPNSVPVVQTPETNPLVVQMRKETETSDRANIQLDATPFSSLTNTQSSVDATQPSDNSHASCMQIMSDMANEFTKIASSIEP